MVPGPANSPAHDGKEPITTGGREETMQTKEVRGRGLRVLSWVLYAIAASVLALSVLAGLSVGSAPAVVPAATIGFQSPALRPMWDALVDGLRWLGVLLFSLGFTISLLFACCGLLLGHTAGLERRLARIEHDTVAGRATATASATASASPVAQPE